MKPVASYAGWRLRSLSSSNGWSSYLLIAPSWVRGIRTLHLFLNAADLRLSLNRDARRLERHQPEVFNWVQNWMAEMPTNQPRNTVQE